MGQDEQVVYIMQDTEEEWVRPTPAGAAIFDSVLEETDLEESDLGELDEYVDPDELRTVLDADGDEKMTITVEGYEVTLDSGGTIDIES